MFGSMNPLMESDQHMQGQRNIAQEDKSEINAEEVESIVGLDQKKREEAPQTGRPRGADRNARKINGLTQISTALNIFGSF